MPVCFRARRRQCQTQCHFLKNVTVFGAENMCYYWDMKEAGVAGIKLNKARLKKFSLTEIKDDAYADSGIIFLGNASIV